MVIVVGSEKGGTGKTTIATNLAIYRAHAGRDVLLVDADPQGSAIEFSRVRESEGHTPTLTCVMITGRSVASVGLADEAAEMTKDLSHIRLLDVRIGYRVAYRRAAAEGQAVSELTKKDPRAVSELESLAQEVFRDA